MKRDSIVGLSKHQGLSSAAGAVAVAFALIVIGYGIAKPPEARFMSPSEAAAAVQAQRTLPDVRVAAPSVDTTSMTAASMAQRLQSLPRIEAPRACDISSGITEACTFE